MGIKDKWKKAKLEWSKKPSFLFLYLFSQPCLDRTHSRTWTKTKDMLDCPTTFLMSFVKFIYSGKATKFFEIFTLLLSVWTVDKSKVKISQNCLAFSEYTNFTILNKVALIFLTSSLEM